MKRTLDELRKDALTLITDIEFEYKGKRGVLCPYRRDKFVLAYTADDPGTEFNDLDKLLNAPYFGGKSMAQVCGDMEFLT